jgi:hypothetical protein
MVASVLWVNYSKENVMYTQEDVTLVMVNWNNRPCMELALKSYVKHHYRGSLLMLDLTDNGSQDDSMIFLATSGVPFYRLNFNGGHEAVLNMVFNSIRTKCALICDTDIEFLENIYDKYLPFINDKCKLVGEYITRDQLNGPVKPRVGAWFMLTDIDALKKAGVEKFRDKSDWSYDVGSQYTENVLQNGFTIHHIPRINADIDRDIIGMVYDGFVHYGKCSWDPQKHPDREGEIKMRMEYIINERLPLYSDIDLNKKLKR